MSLKQLNKRQSCLYYVHIIKDSCSPATVFIVFFHPVFHCALSPTTLSGDTYYSGSILVPENL